MDPSRVLVATVLENREPYLSEVQLLFRTLRQFGGTMAAAQKVAFFVESADPEITQRLQQLGVDVHVVSRVSGLIPWANKLQMFASKLDYDYLVALDNDIVVAGDFSRFVPGDGVAAKPVDQDPFSDEEWQEMFGHFGVPFPTGRVRTTFQGRDTVPYFNSGVIVVSRALAFPLHTGWLAYIRAIESQSNPPPTLQKNPWTSDQIALTFALSKNGIPFRALPPQMNFPVHGALHPQWNPDAIEPLLIHHHHLVTPKGRILRARHDQANRSLGRINDFLVPPSSNPAAGALDRMVDFAAYLTRRVARRLMRAVRKSRQANRRPG